MSVSFIRIDDRMIHGQTCTRWAREYPCDGLIAVNDKAAKNDVLKAAYKAASGKKTFVWTLDDFQKKAQKVLDSDIDIDAKVQKLINKANNRGGTDNISVAYLQKEENE